MTDPSTHQPVIVAGYDGSAESLVAVALGIERAATGGHLVVVHSYEVPADYIGASYYQSMLADGAAAAERAIEQLERDCPGLSAVDYESDIVTGPAAGAICRVAEARGAAEIIVGSRGVGRMRALLGSVAHDVIHRAACPVTVVPQRMLERPDAVERAGSYAA